MAHFYIDIIYRRSEIVPKIISFPIHEIIRKEWNDTIVKFCFLHNKSEEMVVKQWEKLHSIKSEGTCC